MTKRAWFEAWPDNDDGVEVQEPLHGEHVPEDDVDEAEASRERADEIPDDGRDLNGEVPEDSEPDDGRDELVDEGPVVVALLVEDDAQQHRRRHHDADRWEGDRARLRKRAFEHLVKVEDVARKRKKDKFLGTFEQI